MENLREFKQNIHSQFGEDGVILEILRRIDTAISSFTLDRWCVEFGAWDGISGSNPYNLIRNFGYRGVLIEPEDAKFKGLVSNLADSKHYKIKEYVGLEFTNKLDSILHRTEIPYNFDFLSIDIDGMDFYIWKSLENYRPKIVCIEFNPTIPEHIFFVQPPVFALSQGSSPLSLIGLAKEKRLCTCKRYRLQSHICYFRAI